MDMTDKGGLVYRLYGYRSKSDRKCMYFKEVCDWDTPLAVNDILMKFNKEDRKIVAYTDDVVIFVSNIMKTSLGILLSWAKSKGLGVNPG